MPINTFDEAPSAPAGELGVAGRGMRSTVTGTAWLLASLSMAASLAGLLVPDVYGDVESTTTLLRAYDVVNVLVVVPLLMVTTVATRRGSALGHLVLVSVAAYLVYTYAYYLFGTGFNDLFLLHVAVFTMALALLVVSLVRLDVAEFADRVSPPSRVRPSAGILGLIALALGTMWVALALENAMTGEVPAGSQLVETDTVVHLGMALDLALLVPLYAVAATMLWRRAPWGFVLSAVAVISGLLHQVSYVVALPSQVAAGVPGAVAYDLGEPFVVLAYLMALVMLLRRVGVRR